jgi:hypothetical protein
VYAIWFLTEGLDFLKGVSGCGHVQAVDRVSGGEYCLCILSTSYPSSEVKWKYCQIGMAIRNVDSNLYLKLGGQRPHMQAYATKCYTFT